MLDTTAVQTLDELLQQAMASVRVEERHRRYSVSVDEYLLIQKSRRYSYDPEDRMLAGRFQPVIQDTTVQARLLSVVRDALGQYIGDDRLQSAKIVTGGALGGFHVDELVSHMLAIALIRGTHHAAYSFYECAEGTSVRIQFVTLIDGIRIENPIEVSKGIRLIPVPGDVRDFPLQVLTRAHGHYTEYFGRTLMVVDQSVSPIFTHPDKMAVEHAPFPFVRANVCTEYPDFNEQRFCEALSLSINHVVEYVAWWSYIDPDEVYAVETVGRSAAHTPSASNPSNSPAEVREEDIREAMSIYVAQKDLKPDVAQRLRVPVSRWMMSRASKGRVDAFINLGTALESLYLDDSDNSELGYKLALRAAWHLGDDAEERYSLKQDFKRMYDLRSRAVHTGDPDKVKTTPEFTATAQKLCLESIVRIIRDGRFPSREDWERLVVGSAPNSQ